MADRNMWGIVLAGGAGTRLAETTRRLYGSSLPKQFVSFGRQRSFLQATVDRLVPTIPTERIVVVVAEQYAALAREQLRGRPGVEIVGQPSSKGTGAGVLLPLLHVLRRDLSADIALIPSDHDFSDASVLRATLLQARAIACAATSGVVLLGAKAEAPTLDLGWIETRPSSIGSGAMEVSLFVEKPSAAQAERLYRAGALWNTMLCVARGEALWALAQEHLPTQTALFARYARLSSAGCAEQALREAYKEMEPADFSRDLLGAARNLCALTLEGAGWSDCGTPERLLRAFGSPSASGIRRAVAGPPRCEPITGAA